MDKGQKTDAKATRSFTQLSTAQKERLEYIDFRLYFLGEIGRGDLIQQFNIGTAGATRDFAKYMELAPNNMDFRGSTKTYITGKHFKPLFTPVVVRALSALARGFAGGISKPDLPLLPCDYPQELSTPSVETLATVSRAIYRRKPIHLRYCSITSGWSERELVPHTLADSGLRWHVRAFDRKSNEFRDFVLNRMESPSIVEDGTALKHEQAEADTEWTRVVELELVPHPNYKHGEIIKRDYRMTDGVLKVRVRAAQVGYMLRRWNIDCSPDHSLEGYEYQLWLRDPLTLYGVKNLMLAPGYQAPKPAQAKPQTRSR